MVVGTEERDSRDNDWLAPVSYLPGVLPALAEATPEEAAERVARGGAGRAGDGRTTSGSGGDGRSASGRAGHGRSAAGRNGSRDGGNVEAAGDIAVRALARRGLSRREVERELARHELPEDAIASEVERLEERGWIDDMALAQDLVVRLQERKGYGRQAIAAELTRRLLAPAAIEYALDLVDAGEELHRAQEIALKRVGQLRGLDRETQKRRLSAYLARRGYPGSTARAAIDYALAAE